MKKLTRAQKTTFVKLANAYIENHDEHLARHRSHCDICKHPACSFIEEAFVQWISPETIMKKYDLRSRTTIYHHAHALKLFELRDSTLRYALGNIIEQSDLVSVTARDVIHAAYTYSHINDQGLWVQPESHSEVVVSRNESAGLTSALPDQPVSASLRLPAKPAKRRRRSPATPSPEPPKHQPGQETDVAAAYVQAAAPDPPDPNAKEDWRAVANRFFGKVQVPDRDPNSKTGTMYFDAYRFNPDPK